MDSQVRSRLHLSHSQVQEFLICPRRYHLHRRLGLPVEFVPSGLLFGSAAHEALAFYNQMRLEGKSASWSHLLEVFEDRWQREDLPIRMKKGQTESSLISKAGKVLRAYTSDPHCYGEVVAVEEPFRFRLSERVPEVWGVMDLVERAPEKRLVVTDFKTARSRSEPSPEQLILYREAVRALGYSGSDDIGVRYVLLLKTKEPAVAVYELNCRMEQTDRLKRLYEAVWADIRGGCCFPRPGWQCAGCQWKSHCEQG